MLKRGLEPLQLPPCCAFGCKCFNLSVGVTLNVQFATNGMCVKNKTPTYAAQTSKHRVSMVCVLYCGLLPQCEALQISHSGLLIATKWCCD